MIARALSIAALSIMLAASTASAQRVLVVATGDSPTIMRLEAELSAANLEPIREHVEEIPDSHALDAIARERGASACVTIAPPLVRVSIVDRDVHGELSFDSGSDDPDEIVVLRAVELLRASLLEVHVPGPLLASPVENAPRAPSSRPEPAARDPIAIELGLLVLGSPDGADPRVQIRIGASLRLDRWLALALDAWVPFYPVVVSAPEGAADLWIGELSLVARVPLLDDTELLMPHVGAGVLGVVVAAQGRANPPFASRSSSAVGAGPLVEVGARWSLTRILALRADLTAALLPSPLAIRFAGRAVATFGWPVIAGSIALEIVP